MPEDPPEHLPKDPTGLRDAVAARTPVDSRERDSIATFLMEFDSLGSPFDEDASPTHVTASAIVTGAAGVVLHLHKRLGLWLQPGGHIDRGEMPWEAAQREALEETGLPVTPVAEPSRLLHVDVHPGPRGHTHLDVRYQFSAPDIVPAPSVGESLQVGWFSWAKAIAMADPGLEGVLRAVQPGQPTLRRAVIGDAAGCARVYTRCRAYRVPAVPDPRSEEETAVWMAERAIPEMDMWVADVDGVVVGQLVQAPGGTRDPYIDPSWIGRGLDDRFIALVR